MKDEFAVIKKLAAEIVDSKKRGAPSSDVQALYLKGLLCVTQLKASVRQLTDETEQVRESTAAAKALSDNAEISLQNLLYEKGHYLKEIRACESFRSNYSDEQIGLMPEAEFLETSPGQFREDIDDPHKLMLQRLEHEKHERLEALKKVEALRTRRDALAATVAGKRANMTTLEEQFAAVRATAEPLRMRLGIPPSKRPPGQLRSAALLPLPLHIAYVELSAALEAFDLPGEVSIAGSLAEAEALASTADEAVHSMQEEVSSEGEKEPDLEPGEHRPAKRPRSAPGTSDPGGKAHSLLVQVKLGEAGQRTLTLQLRYIMPLKLLTAQCTDAADNGRLQRLMQGDDGLAVPSEAAHLAAGGELTWDPTRPDRPYRWAQQLGGIRALPPLNATGFPVQGESMAPEAVPDIRREARPQHILESLRGILLAASNR